MFAVATKNRINNGLIFRPRVPIHNNSPSVLTLYRIGHVFAVSLD